MKILLTALFIMSIAGCQFCCDTNGHGCAQRCTNEAK